jgi:hypothetical protein
MSQSFVRLAPDSSGRKIQTFENSVAAQTVEAQAIVAIDATGWSDSFVQIAPDSTGKKIQYFENTVGGNVVETLAVVLVDSTGAPI